jgi:hypothetical protein
VFVVRSPDELVERSFRHKDPAPDLDGWGLPSAHSLVGECAADPEELRGFLHRQRQSRASTEVHHREDGRDRLHRERKGQLDKLADPSVESRRGVRWRQCDTCPGKSLPGQKTGSCSVTGPAGAGRVADVS